MSATLPRRLAELAAARPAAVAMQEKRRGIWQPITWAEYAAHVSHLARGLAGLGVRRGGAIAILGDNRPEWLIAELAAQCLGAAVLGIAPTSTGDDLDVLDRAEVRVVVAEDQEQVDKLLPVTGRPSRLEHILYYDPRGLEHYHHDGLRKLSDVVAQGRRDAEVRPSWLDGEIAAGAAGDPAVLCVTSRSPGPRLAVLSHADLLAMADQLHRAAPLHAGQRYVSFLPLAWIEEQVLAVACGLAHGLLLAFPEDAATEGTDLREIGPELMFGPPRIWETLRASVQAGIDDAGWLKPRVFRWAYGVGDAVARCRAGGGEPGLRLAAAHKLAGVLALGPVRDRLGLARIQHGYTGASLSPEVLGFFRAIGVDLEPMDLGGHPAVDRGGVLQRDGSPR